MSQRVWTCTLCGWRSTAENVGGPGQRGDPPPHCRRCRVLSLSVTIEKHPKVTRVCKNPECRQDFVGWPGATHCPKCRSTIRGKKIWDGRRKYVWTPERNQILRDHYNHNATAIAQQYFPGWPKWAIVHQAQALGLCRTKEKPWTKAEDAFLTEWAGVHTAQWMQKELRRRTVTAIVVRLKRLKLNRRIQADGLTLSQLESALGVDHRQIIAWWRSGRLKGTHRTNPNEHERYEFQEHDVVDLLLKHPSCFRLDRVDQAWFMGLMRDAIERTTSDPSRAHAVSRREPASSPLERQKTVVARVVLEDVACIGVDDQTPCADQKRVMPRRNIPARCPDCTLEFRRRLRLEDIERLRRIRASAAPASLEHTN